jgi:hypothetical protein
MMKKQLTILLGCLLFFTIEVLAQVNALKQPGSIAYIGMENLLQLKVASSTDFGNITVSVNAGTIRMGKDGRCFWTICDTDKKEGIVKVYKGAALIDSLKFRLAPLPDPDIFIGMQDDQFIFTSENIGVRAEIVNFVVDGILPAMERFTITVIRKNGTVTQVVNSGAYYNRQSLELFARLEVGDKIILSDFVVLMGCHRSVRKLTKMYSCIYAAKRREFRY